MVLKLYFIITGPKTTMCCHLANNIFCGLGRGGFQISYQSETFYRIKQNLILCGSGCSDSIRLILYVCDNPLQSIFKLKFGRSDFKFPEFNYYFIIYRDFLKSSWNIFFILKFGVIVIFYLPISVHICIMCITQS